MTSPSRLSRESTTRSTVPLQKGHFMREETRSGGRATRGTCRYLRLSAGYRPPLPPLLAARAALRVFRLPLCIGERMPAGGEHEHREPDQRDENERGEPG